MTADVLRDSEPAAAPPPGTPARPSEEDFARVELMAEDHRNFYPLQQDSLLRVLAEAREARGRREENVLREARWIEEIVRIFKLVGIPDPEAVEWEDWSEYYEEGLTPAQAIREDWALLA